MKIEIFKNWRTLLSVIILTIFVNWQIIDAATDDYDSIYDRDHYGSVYDAIIAYHKDVNDVFNDAIKTFTTEDDPIVEYDPECPDANVSTYCVSTRVVPLYIDFLEALDDHAQYVMDEGDTTSNISEVTDIASNRIKLIDLERENAFNILDFTLAAYNEFQLMYPIHNEYEKLIKDFEKYNEELGDWREQIYKWPGDFIDVSTTECT